MLFNWSYATTASAQQVEIDKCVVLSKSASYVLTRNIPHNGKYLVDGSCIQVAADNVTIDLNGFSVIGDGIGAGITDDGDQYVGTSIMNGTVTGFEDGVDLGSSSITTIDRLAAIQNIFNQVDLNPASGGDIITNSQMVGIGLGTIPPAPSTGAGLLSGTGDVIVGNFFGSNWIGLSAGANSVVKGNVARANGIGMNILCSAVVVDNVAANNTTNITYISGGCQSENNVGEPAP